MTGAGRTDATCACRIFVRLEPVVREAPEYAAASDTMERLRNKIRLLIASETEQEQVLPATVLDVSKTDKQRVVAFG